MTLVDLASALPLALALRISTAAVTILTARRRGAARRVAFLGSAVASLATRLGGRSRLEYRHAGERRAVRASGLRVVAGVFDRRIVRVVSSGSLHRRRSDRHLQSWIRRRPALEPTVRVPRRYLQRPAGFGRTCVCRQRSRHLPVCLGVDDVGDGGARGHGARGAGLPARRLSLPGHVASRHGLVDRGIPDAGVRIRLAVIRDPAVGWAGDRTDQTRLVRVLLPRLWCQGGYRSAPCLAARGPPGGALPASPP